MAMTKGNQGVTIAKGARIFYEDGCVGVGDGGPPVACPHNAPIGNVRR